MPISGRLGGRRVLITGAGAGIGRATAQRFATEGVTDIAVVDKVRERLEVVTAELRDGGARPLAIEADLSDVDAARRCATDAIAHFGGIDVLVANAGASALQSFVDTTVETLERVFTVNVFSSYIVAQEIARDMLARRAPGVLLFTASTSDT